MEKVDVWINKFYPFIRVRVVKIGDDEKPRCKQNSNVIATVIFRSKLFGVANKEMASLLDTKSQSKRFAISQRYEYYKYYGAQQQVQQINRFYLALYTLCCLNHNFKNISDVIVNFWADFCRLASRIIQEFCFLAAEKKIWLWNSSKTVKMPARHNYRKLFPSKNTTKWEYFILFAGKLRSRRQNISPKSENAILVYSFSLRSPDRDFPQLKSIHLDTFSANIKENLQKLEFTFRLMTFTLFTKICVIATNNKTKNQKIHCRWKRKFKEKREGPSWDSLVCELSSEKFCV